MDCEPTANRLFVEYLSRASYELSQVIFILGIIGGLGAQPESFPEP